MPGAAGSSVFSNKRLERGVPDGNRRAQLRFVAYNRLDESIKIALCQPAHFADQAGGRSWQQPQAESFAVSIRGHLMAALRRLVQPGSRRWLRVVLA